MSAAAPSLPPVRPPPRRLWREFRIQVLPWIGFALLAMIVALLWADVVLTRPVPAADPDPPADELDNGSGTRLAPRPAYPAYTGVSNRAPVWPLKD